MYGIRYSNGFSLTGVLFGILAFLFWVLIIGGFMYLAIHYLSSHEHHTHYDHHHGSLSSDTAFDIAQKRYASGEITKEEYDKLKKDLKA